MSEPTPLSAERIKAQAEFHLEWHLPKYGHAGDPCVACLGMTPCATEQLAVGALQQAATIEALQAEVTTLRTALEEVAGLLNEKHVAAYERAEIEGASLRWLSAWRMRWRRNESDSRSVPMQL